MEPGTRNFCRLVIALLRLLAMALDVLLLLLPVASQLPAMTVQPDSLQAKTIHGPVQGIRLPGNGGDPYDAFMGIPYAKPPVRSLRFANPQDPTPWINRLNTIAPKADCIQKNSLLPNPVVTGAEDCLYLNLYRPVRSNHSDLLPVVVFIHGGAFFAGSAGPDALGPQYFMNTGQVMFVAMAYRLGALGFLSTGDANAPGNFGLKDQAKALEWVKRNVRNFGGDPTKVTIMGVSAGAASVHLHMMSPLSRNLFHGGVSMSGNALGPYTDPTPNPDQLARKQAEVLGIRRPNMSNRDLISELRNVRAEDLVNSIDALKFWSVDPLTLYRLVVEPPGTAGAFMLETPDAISKRGNYYKVPWIQGSVQHEGAIRALPILVNATLLDDLNSRLDDLLPKLMELNGTKAQLQVITTKIRERFLNKANAISTDNQNGFIRLYSERSFLYPMYTSIQDFVRTAKDIQKTPVYVYKFQFRGPYSYSIALTHTYHDYGVIHMDDTLYLFQTSIFPPFAPDTPAAKMTRVLVQFYVDFAVTWVPTDFGDLRACNQDAFCGGAFCDYYNFVNDNSSESGYAISVDNYFDRSMVDFWRDILGVHSDY